MNATIRTITELEDHLSEPTPGVLQVLASLDGDVAVLGVGGKLGPTLARMVRRAFDQLGRRDRVFGVARFSTPDLRAQLHRHGIEPITADLLDRAAVQALPDVANVLYLAGQKFGTQAAPELSWALNTLAPALCAEKYARSRLVVFSTGCVYPLVPIASGGAREEHGLEPQGDYGNSCVGRERIFTYFARKNGTPLAVFRLNYANELRYGVLLDVGLKVHRGEPVDVRMGHVNLIWQRDAHARAIQCLALASDPPFIVNVTGLETVSIRAVAERFGAIFGRPVEVAGQEASTALLANADKARALFGPPEVSVEQMIEWIAAWIQEAGTTFGKPTHFEVRDGQF